MASGGRRGEKGGRNCSLIQGGAAKQRYYCNVCPHLCVSYDLKHHYIKHTDWQKLEKLRKCVGEETLKMEMKDTDPHTKYMYKNNHQLNNPPSYLTHKRETLVEKGPMDAFFTRRSSTLQVVVPDESEETEVVAEHAGESEDETEVAEHAGESEDETEVIAENARSEENREDDRLSDEENHDDDRLSDENRDSERLSDEENRDDERLSEEENRDYERLSDDENREDERRGSKRAGEEFIRGEIEAKRSRLSEEEIELIAEKVAQKVDQKRQEREARKEQEEKIEENWITGETMVVCRPCGLYSKNKEIPVRFRVGTRGSSGTIQRIDRQGRRRTVGDLKSMRKRHQKSSLHIWCENKEKREAENQKTYDQKNEEAGLLVTRVAVKVMKRGGGSIDFLADLDLLSLTPGVIYAVKNNSRAAFFDLRDDTFEVVTTKMKEFFRANVKHMSISLDKVTSQHTSYTVIITYFFYRGRLHVVLNELVVLAVEDYDSQGTAMMVVTCLVRTTGFTRTEIAVRLRHSSYDGVIK